MRKSNKGKRILLIFKRLFALTLVIASTATLVTIFVGGGTKVYAADPPDPDQAELERLYFQDGEGLDALNLNEPLNEVGEVNYQQVDYGEVPLLDDYAWDNVIAAGNAAEKEQEKEKAKEAGKEAKKGKTEAAVLRERCKSIGKTIHAVGGLIAAAIKGGDLGPHIVNLTKSTINLVVTLMNKIPGFGEVTDAIFDTVIGIIEAFDGSKQSDTDRLMNFIEDQINLVRDDVAKTRQDIVELSSKMDKGFNEILTALKDSFDNYEAKTHVNNFFSTASGNFSYTQLKRYLYSNYSDGYALELQAQIAKENPNQERITTLENELYASLMSTYNGTTSYLEMFYDSIMKTDGHNSIFKYYCDYLNSNSKVLNNTSPAVASAEFMNDVYCTFMTAVNYVRLLNQSQKAQMILRVQDTQNPNYDDLKYVYGPNQHDYVTYNDIDKIDKRLEEMLDNVDYQISQDLAYISKLDKTYFYKSSDNVFRVATNTNANTFGNVEKGFTLYLPQLNQYISELFGYNVNNFRYVLTDSDNHQLNRGQEDKSTYVVNTDKPFVLTVKYDVTDRSGNPITTTDSNGNSIPLVYDVYQIPFKVGVKNSFSGGNGKPNDPYIISNTEQFMLIPGLDRHTCYSLVADLDFGGKTIEQMFDDIKPYAGTFNGNGFTISNFKIGKSQKQSSLFGFIAATGNVCNLTVKNAEVNKDNDDDSTKMEAAIIAGVNNGSIGRVIIDSCTIKAVRVSKANNDNVNKAITNYTGAIAAENYGSITYCRVKNCTISGYSKREYGSNSDGLNSNDVYAGGAVGYNGSGATLSYISVDSLTKVSAEGNGIADKSLTTRSPRVKAYAGGMIGSAGDRTNIDNLYCETENITASAKALNDSAWGATSKSDAKAKTSQYIAGETTGNVLRTYDFEFKKRNEYDIELAFSERINLTYNIDESLIFYAGASAFSVSDMKFKVKKPSSSLVTILNGVIVSVEGFNSTNTSYSEAKKGKAEIIVYVKDLNAVLRYSVPYCILPDKPTSIAVVGAGNTEFTYSADENEKIVDASASQQLQTTTIRVAHQSGRETNVADTATISVDTTKLGKQKAIIKAENHEFEFDVNVVCSGHDWIDSTAVTVIEGFEKIEDNATHEIYYSVYGYVSKKCANCPTIGRFAFNKTCQAELINVVPATCSTLGYTGDKVAYYIDANTHEKVYLDCIVEKGTIVEQLPHTFTHEDNLVGGSHYDDYGHICSVCGYLEPHLYSPVENSGEIVNGIVYKCDICGHTYIKDNISREDITKLPRVVVNNAYTLAGTKEVVVYVDLHSSVGITSANFSVSFDPELTLISYRLGNILNDANISRFKVYPDHLNVVLAQTSTDVSTDGTILRLVFETPANSAVNSRYKIDVVNKGNTDRFTDKNGNKVEFLSYEGYINVVDRLPGDVNGDGSLDMLDILIVSKYIVLDDIEKLNYISEMRKLHPELSILYADVNLDNIIDTDDVVRMLRFDVGGYESQVVSQKFIVNLNYNDGSGKVEPYQVDYNYGEGKYGALPTVKKAGYRFDGWYTDIEGGDLITSVTPVKYNNDQYVQTLYAHFTLNKIIFDSNGGTGEKPAITISTNSNDMNFGASDKNGNEYFFKDATVRFDTNISVTVLDKVETYRLTFLGWSTSKNGNVISNISSLYDLSNFADLQIGTVTLYAVWKEIEIDNYLPDVSSIAGYSGYTLTGWMLKKIGKASDVVFEPTETKYAINDSITFYAKWDIISYNLVYDGNGGTLTNGYSKYYENDKRTSLATLDLVNNDALGFKKTGYTFAGWTTDQAFAETWFSLVKKNYKDILPAFDYVYYDGEVRTVTDADFVFKDGATLQASANPNPAVIRNNSNNFITAGLVSDLEQFMDENGFVTLYALWTPNKIEITYTTESEDGVLKGTNTLAKDNPITLPYYYGYDIVLPFDYIYRYTGQTAYGLDTLNGNEVNRWRICEMSIPQLSQETFKYNGKRVIYASDLPETGGTFNANVSVIRGKELLIHYLYNGYELFVDYYPNERMDLEPIFDYYFKKDLSLLGISSDYYTISGYRSIIDENGNDGLDRNYDGIISDDEKYINKYFPGDTILLSLLHDPDSYFLTTPVAHPDIYIEVELVGESKLFAGYNAPFVLGDNNTLILNGIGDYSPIRDNNPNEVLIIPDLIRVNGEVRKVREVSCQSLKPTSNYIDLSSTHDSFKTIVFGKNITSIHKELTDYLVFVRELILPDYLDFCWISSQAPSIERIVLSNLSTLSALVLTNPDLLSSTMVDIYYKGSYEEFMEMMIAYPTHRIFNNEHYRIKFYSETEPTISGIPNDNYWYNDNGVIRIWAN